MAERGMRCHSRARRNQGDFAIGHKADKSFFSAKRSWSERKDQILGDYIVPYVPKIATQGKPILIVDGFAGPGKFGDGKPGSPLIICQQVKKALARRTPLQVPVKYIGIESDRELFVQLDHMCQKFDFASARNASLIDALDEIGGLATTHSTFLYLDPYSVEGLDWKALDRVYSLVNTSRSVEVLLNFVTPSFARRGLAAMKLPPPEPVHGEEDLDEIDIPMTTSPSVDKLDRIVGGSWWRSRVRAYRPGGFSELVSDIANEVSSRLRSTFHEVCKHAIKAKPSHRVPKYHLLFASRHPDALRLMNDSMVKSRDTLADQAQPEQPVLFETRPLELVPDLSNLEEHVRTALTTPRTRGEVIVSVIRNHFCVYASTQIRGEIERLLKSGRIKSDTGRVRINDKTRIWIEA